MLRALHPCPIDDVHIVTACDYKTSTTALVFSTSDVFIFSKFVNRPYWIFITSGWQLMIDVHVLYVHHFRIDIEYVQRSKCQKAAFIDLPYRCSQVEQTWTIKNQFAFKQKTFNVMKDHLGSVMA